jgi:hypothetical protein
MVLDRTVAPVHVRRHRGTELKIVYNEIKRSTIVVVIAVVKSTHREQVHNNHRATGYTLLGRFQGIVTLLVTFNVDTAEFSVIEPLTVGGVNRLKHGVLDAPSLICRVIIDMQLSLLPGLREAQFGDVEILTV